MRRALARGGLVSRYEGIPGGYRISCLEWALGSRDCVVGLLTYSHRVGLSERVTVREAYEDPGRACGRGVPPGEMVGPGLGWARLAASC